MNRLLRTLADVGPRRLQRRLRVELRQRLDRRLPPTLALSFCRCGAKSPPWRPSPAAWPFPEPLAPPATGTPPLSIPFTFLNQERHLAWPIPWGDPHWPRLWQFDLHAFDWARDWLHTAEATGTWPPAAAPLEPLIDHWIAANPPGRGDGWHSYTLSLRIRTWIRLFRACPALLTPLRLRSLWQQLCWLQAHPEHCHGGNHWLENLTALAIGGLQFSGAPAAAMGRRALRLLERELANQVLPDGGHEERSASYHLLMLDRLLELADQLQAFSGACPPWLLQAISAMAAWAATIRLADGSFPRFNDSAADAAPPLDAVLASARALLGQPIAPSPPPLVDLPHTGWTLLRPGAGWELAFKCGVPCPPHLGAHAHSDLLSLDLWHHGRPVIAEVGTSVYGAGPDRQFERGSSAHNSLQLGVSRQGSIQWIEPVEVWAGFRAGRKAQPLARRQGREGPWLWASGSHDGYRSISAQHFRWLALRLTPENQPILLVIDAITALQPLHWRSWWHLGPGCSSNLAETGLRWQGWPPLSETPGGYTASGFGQRLPAPTLDRHGSLPAGRQVLISALVPKSTLLTVSSNRSFEGHLVIPGLVLLQWEWPPEGDELRSLSPPHIQLRPC